MKKLILVLATVSAVTFGAFAQKDGSKFGQRGGDPTKMAEKRSERLKSDLNLSDKQFAEVSKLNKENALARDAERKEMKANHEAKKMAYKNDMKKILTPEQYKTFEEKIAKNEAGRKEGMRKGNGQRPEGQHRGGRPEKKG